MWIKLVKHLFYKRIFLKIIKPLFKTSIMQNLKGYLAVCCLRLFGLLPWFWAQKMGGFLGYLCYLLPTKTKKVAQIQLQECFPHLVPNKTFAENIFIWLNPPTKTLQFIHKIYGENELKTALKSNKGTVCLAMHLGSWEILGHYLGNLQPSLSFYRPIKIKQIDEFIQLRRSKSQMVAVPSNKKGILAIIKEVKKGGLVGIPIDNEPSLNAGIFAPFLATTALTSKFAHTLLAGEKAHAFFIYAIRSKNGLFDLHIEPADKEIYNQDVTRSASALSASLAHYIEQNPSHYLWSMKRFKHRPPPLAKLY